jgi:hypothetical protein
MVLGMAPVFGGGIQKPVIFSYYWPISDGQKDPLIWNMDTPTIIDIPRKSNKQWIEAKTHWEKKGKIFLYRVNPFRDISSEEQMYERFASNIEDAAGIAIDEIATRGLTKKKVEMFGNVLAKIRKKYPDKLIAVWCTGEWSSENSIVLTVIRDYADLFLPEIYLSQRTAKRKGLGAFKRYLNDAEERAPGITEMTVVGLGLHPKMVNSPSNSFRDHLSSQIELLGTDPFFKHIAGVALYAPVYLTTKDQKWIDGELKKHFAR